VYKPAPSAVQIGRMQNRQTESRLLHYSGHKRFIALRWNTGLEALQLSEGEHWQSVPVSKEHWVVWSSLRLKACSPGCTALPLESVFHQAALLLDMEKQDIWLASVESALEFAAAE